MRNKMPMPHPSKNETKESFIERCMGSDMMKSEFPKNDQRLAVCMQVWSDKDKKKDSERKEEENARKEQTD